MIWWVHVMVGQDKHASTVGFLQSTVNAYLSRFLWGTVLSCLNTLHYKSLMQPTFPVFKTDALHLSCGSTYSSSVNPSLMTKRPISHPPVILDISLSVIEFKLWAPSSGGLLNCISVTTPLINQQPLFSLSAPRAAGWLTAVRQACWMMAQLYVERSNIQGVMWGKCAIEWTCFRFIGAKSLTWIVDSPQTQVILWPTLARAASDFVDGLFPQICI